MSKGSHYFIVVLMFILLLTTLLTFFLSFSVSPPREDETPRRSRPVFISFPDGINTPGNEGESGMDERG